MARKMADVDEQLAALGQRAARDARPASAAHVEVQDTWTASQSHRQRGPRL